MGHLPPDTGDTEPLRQTLESDWDLLEQMYLTTVCTGEPVGFIVGEVVGDGVTGALVGEAVVGEAVVGEAVGDPVVGEDVG